MNSRLIANLSPRRILASRGVWALGDQGVVSMGNFLTQILLARTVTVEEYRSFSLLFLVMLLLVQIHHALVVYPLSLRGADERSDLPQLAGGSMLLTLGSAPLIALVLLTACFALGRLDLVLPAAIASFARMMQETSRRALLSRLKYAHAVPGDALAYLGAVACILVFRFNGAISDATAFYAMAIAATAGAMLQAAQLKVKLGLDLQAMSRDYWRTGKWLLGGALITGVLVQAIPWTLQARWSADDVAGMQAAANLLNLANPVLFGVCGLIVPAMAAVHLRDGAVAATRVGTKYALLGISVSATYFILLMAAPHLMLGLFYGFGSIYVNPTMEWVLRLMAFAYLVFHAGQLTMAMLNGLEQPRRSFVAQVFGFGTEVGIAVPITAWKGLLASAWVSIIPSSTQFVVALILLRRSVKKQKADRSHVPVDPHPEPVSMAP